MRMDGSVLSVYCFVFGPGLFYLLLVPDLSHLYLFNWNFYFNVVFLVVRLVLCECVTIVLNDPVLAYLPVLLFFHFGRGHIGITKSREEPLF